MIAKRHVYYILKVCRELQEEKPTGFYAPRWELLLRRDLADIRQSGYV